MTGCATAASGCGPALLPSGGKDKGGRVPLSQIELLPSDPVAQEAATEEIKKKYSQYLGI